MIPLLKVHEYYRVENIVNNDRLEGVVNNDKLENIIEQHYSLRRNRYGYPRSNEKV